MRNKIITFLIVALLAVGFFVYTRSFSKAVQNNGPVVNSHVSSSTIRLQFFGDIMLDRNVAKHMGTSGLDYIFAFATGTEKFWGGADLTIANLEGPFAPRRVLTSKSIAFRFDPKFALQLKSFGLDAVSLANNHSYDMGARNVVFTRATLGAAGLGYFGDELHEGPIYTWIASSTAQVSEPVAFIGLHNTYHELDLATVSKAIIAAQKQARYVIVFMHWGAEYQRISNTKQRNLAHWLIDRGVVAVIGAHPHVIEETEIYKGRPIFYSLGNFIFDQYFSRDTQEGLSVELALADGQVLSARLIPFYSKNSQVHKMIGQRATEFFAWMGKYSRVGGKSFVDGVLNF